MVDGWVGSTLSLSLDSWASFYMPPPIVDLHWLKAVVPSVDDGSKGGLGPLKQMIPAIYRLQNKARERVASL